MILAVSEENEMHQSRIWHKKRIEITHQDLPLRCPRPKHSQWDSHPQVFLDIEKTGQVLCPYCATLYVLVDEEQ